MNAEDLCANHSLVTPRRYLKIILLYLTKKTGYCDLHTNMRGSDHILAVDLKTINSLSPKWHSTFSQHISDDCGVSGFHFFGTKDKKPGDMLYSNTQWPDTKKLLHRLDLSLLYGNLYYYLPSY